MKILVFEKCLGGHRLEYLHHIYMMGKERSNDDFLFVVPDSFEKKKADLNWPEFRNVHFIFIHDEDIKRVEAEKNLVKSSYLNTRLLKKYVKEFNPDSILLISLIDYMPWLAFSGIKRNSIRGIIYKIYLYNDFRGIRKYVNRFIYYLFAHRKCMNTIFILNDNDSANKLNALYNTTNFHYLPDPVPLIDFSKVRCMREELGVKSSDRMFLHFGGLSERKGTLIILDAIEMISQDELKDKVFVFAGVVYNDIRERFYAKKKKIDERARIIVYDEFCPYSLIYNLCESCDVILIPYQTTGQSSGVIGYASFFNKPVIGPSRGLIGKLIRDYNMGVRLEDVNAEIVKESICGELPTHSFDYIKNHTVSNFTSALLL